MKQSRQQADRTSNSRVYTLTKRFENLSCSYCRPNKGCNSKYREERSWKDYRRTQYKTYKG